VRRDHRGARAAPPSLHARAPPEPAASSGERGRNATAAHRGLGAPTPGNSTAQRLPVLRPLPAGERGLREGGAGAGGDGRRAGGVLPPGGGAVNAPLLEVEDLCVDRSGLRVLDRVTFAL